MSKIKKLLEPIKIGKLELRNRIVMPPMSTRFATPDGVVTRRMVDYYVERAKGGVGLIIVEYAYIDTEASRGGFCQLGVYSDDLIAGLNWLAEAVKAHGSKIALQICHSGRQTTPAITGRQPVAPSAIPYKRLGGAHTLTPRELTTEEIEGIIESFGEAARRAKVAGFDAVELHGAHGYLLGQFLSSYTNKRTDKYGGDPEGRSTFALEVVKRVRKKVGTDFLIGYRMSADEYVNGGLTLKDTRKFAKMLGGSGVNYIHVSVGIHETICKTIQPMYLPRGYNVHLAEGIKHAVNIPVVAVGSIDPELGENILEEGKADLVAMGRGLIADPELPKKLVEGRMENIRPCIREIDGCLGRIREGKMMSCAVNPAVGKEEEYRLRPAEKGKKVVVVGGGAAGLEAAIVARLRGHDVTLYEKEDKLGGHLVEASVPQFKDDLRGLMRFYFAQLKKTGVKVQLKTEVTPELIMEVEPDVLILAVGSIPIISDIPGVTKPAVVTAIDVLLGKTEVGEEVAVVGGGLIGCETALYLATEKGKTVTILEMLDEIAIEVEPTVAKVILLKKLTEANVRVLTGIKLDKITDEGIIGIDKEGKGHTVKADNVVLALGLKPREEVVRALKGLVPETYAVGDCVEPRKIMDAIHEGFRVALDVRARKLLTTHINAKTIHAKTIIKPDSIER